MHFESQRGVIFLSDKTLFFHPHSAGKKILSLSSCEEKYKTGRKKVSTRESDLVLEMNYNYFPNFCHDI